MPRLAANPAASPYLSLCMVEWADLSAPTCNGGGEWHSSYGGYAGANRAAIEADFRSLSADQPYLVYEGSVLDTVLMNRLDGDSPLAKQIQQEAQTSLNEDLQTVAPLPKGKKNAPLSVAGSGRCAVSLRCARLFAAFTSRGTER